MTRQAHLVGSVGLRDVETVLRTVSESLRPGRPRNTHIDLEKKVEVLTRELGKALEQQAAVSEILRVISSSPGNLQTVFETILANATRLCEASYGALWLSEGDRFRNAAFHGALPAEYMELWRSATVSRTAPVGRVAQSRKPVQIADLREDQTYLTTAIH